ncbi:hypothetical protein SLS60_010923 [Paraconiothyrium brasiliense]|uniref:Uncharacterized protein n=1 Tax=Paraconiothyrium brasiliense TaxID=300254 RepID=A0ABR3QMD9_9PLEO
MDTCTRFMVWAYFIGASFAAVAPQPRRQELRSDAKQLQTRDERVVMTDPQTGRQFVPGETSQARTVYTVVALSCAVVLALLFVLIINWLTIGSAKAEKALTTLVSQQTVSEAESDRDGPVPPTIMQSRLSGLGERPPPAKLQDAGKLLVLERVSSVAKNNDGPAR